jgi:hypothetical protein
LIHGAHQKWIERIRERPSAQAAVQIPPSTPPKTKEEEDKLAALNSKWIMAASK